MSRIPDLYKYLYELLNFAILYDYILPIQSASFFLSLLLHIESKTYELPLWTCGTGSGKSDFRDN